MFSIRQSAVAKWLAFCPLLLEVPFSISMGLAGECGDLAVSPLVRETSRNVWELSNLTWVKGQPWEREKKVI